jgi:hypothetical protein
LRDMVSPQIGIGGVSRLLPPTPPYVRVRIRRFAGLSADGLFCVCARGSDRRRHVLASALRAAPSGLHPFPPLRRPVPWIFCRMASSRFPPPASFQRSGLQRNSFRLLRRLLTSPPRSRALRPAQSGVPDTTEISRGKIDRLPCTPAGFTTPALDDRGLRDYWLARPAG